MSISSQIDVLNEVFDISKDFYKLENEYFIAASLDSFNTLSGQGVLRWNKCGYYPNWAFTKIGFKFKKLAGKEIPQEDYEIDPSNPFAISLISPRTIRIKLNTTKTGSAEESSLILAGAVNTDPSWQVDEDEKQIIYQSEFAKFILDRKPWSLKFFDSTGKLLTQTEQEGSHHKALPFLYLRRLADYSRSIAAVFTLSYDEKIYGCGESYTRLDKRGQKIPLYMTDV